jgi:hypothetical protein
MVWDLLRGFRFGGYLATFIGGRIRQAGVEAGDRNQRQADVTHSLQHAM